MVHRDASEAHLRYTNPSHRRKLNRGVGVRSKLQGPRCRCCSYYRKPVQRVRCIQHELREFTGALTIAKTSNYATYRVARPGPSESRGRRDVEGTSGIYRAAYPDERVPVRRPVELPLTSRIHIRDGETAGVLVRLRRRPS